MIIFQTGRGGKESSAPAKPEPSLKVSNLAPVSNPAPVSKLAPASNPAPVSNPAQAFNLYSQPTLRPAFPPSSPVSDPSAPAPSPLTLGSPGSAPPRPGTLSISKGSRVPELHPELTGPAVYSASQRQSGSLFYFFTFL